jgi:hypothetical protein
MRGSDPSPGGSGKDENVLAGGRTPDRTADHDWCANGVDTLGPAVGGSTCLGR